ncbi:cysteine desulfurase family protein [Sphingomonas quercus]|uniref:Cysteine desulfurase n=1 Tax=Sphingomonas quercus TaxID=2842451 RepID=A0ABS6BGL2_9SPHN|nr:cysteine desulfurase family protein [Sphingomonas quercus]MBU3076717.1 cysteine desulfurase [Sphingomonas quercus]
MIYLDYQATTPLAPEARAAMLPYLEADYGNPHSPHRLGRSAAAAVEAARVRVLAHFEGRQGRLYFTSGATEAANWALKGAMAAAPAGRRRIVTLATEHACVLDTARWLGEQGHDLVVLPVTGDGLVDLAAAARAIDDSTAIVAAMLVNNEIGVIQPLDGLAALARAAGALFFCDAVQGFGRVALPQADMIAISAHKVHGPKGIGALFVADGVALEPLMHGGGQEGGARSGTLSPALCAGFGAAAALMVAAAERAHCEGLRDALLGGIGPAWVVNGALDRRWPGNLSLRRPGFDAARFISENRRIAVSAGSACASGSGRPSHVLEAIGLSAGEARSTLRIGFGRYTTLHDIIALQDALA